MFNPEFLSQHLDGCDRWLLSTPLAEGSSEEALLTIKFTQVLAVSV